MLGVAADASQATIKAAWRRLAREHHPDLTGGDPAAARAATRRMAEINAAYESRRATAGPGRAGAGAQRSAGGPPRGPGPSGSYADAGPIGTAGRAPGGAPRPKPHRPVTGRLDTTETFRPRNATTTPGARRAAHPLGQQPYRSGAEEREAPRASDPTGPLRRSRVRRFRPPEPPPLEVALAKRIEFGKFHGHTLGEIAAFEPSYIDWVAATITRDPELVAAARVVRDDLDERGVARRRRGHPAGTATADPGGRG